MLARSSSTQRLSYPSPLQARQADVAPQPPPGSHALPEQQAPPVPAHTPIDVAARSGLSERHSKTPSVRLKLAMGDGQLPDFDQRLAHMKAKLPWLKPESLVALEDGCLVIHTDHWLGLQLVRTALTPEELKQPDIVQRLVDAQYLDTVQSACTGYASAWEARCAGVQPGQPPEQPVSIPMPASPKVGATAYEAWMDDLLQAHDTFIVTETHRSAGAADFILQNMQTFAADKRAVLTEYLPAEWQPAVNDFMVAKTRDQDDACLVRMGLPTSAAPVATLAQKDQLRLALLRGAREHKVQLLGIDSTLATMVQGDTTDAGLAKRAASMNEVACRVHEDRGLKKSVIHAGVAHGRHSSFPGGVEVPGVGHVLGVPVLYCDQESSALVSRANPGLGQSASTQMTFSGADRVQVDNLSHAYDLKIRREAGSWHALPERLWSDSSDESDDDDSSGVDSTRSGSRSGDDDSSSRTSLDDRLNPQSSSSSSD